MIYAAIDVDIVDHPKAIAAGASMYLWLWGMAWIRKHKGDGWIPNRAIRRCAWGEQKANTRARKKLIRVGLWLEAEDGILVHNYQAKNDSREVIAARITASQRRQAEYRERKKTVTSPVTKSNGDGNVMRNGDGNVMRNGEGNVTHNEKMAPGAGASLSLSSPLRSESATRPVGAARQSTPPPPAQAPLAPPPVGRSPPRSDQLLPVISSLPGVTGDPGGSPQRSDLCVSERAGGRAIDLRGPGAAHSGLVVDDPTGSVEDARQAALELFAMSMAPPPRKVVLDMSSPRTVSLPGQRRAVVGTEASLWALDGSESDRLAATRLDGGEAPAIAKVKKDPPRSRKAPHA